MELNAKEIEILVEASKAGGLIYYLAQTPEERMAAKHVIELGLAYDQKGTGGSEYSFSLTFEGEKRALEEIGKQ